MLTGLLRLLAEGRAGSLAELATMLGTDERGLAVALAHCQRLGYLEPADAGCTPGVGGGIGATGACGGCPVAGACLLEGDPDQRRPSSRRLSMAPTWWRLTDRGARAVRLPAASTP
ncbi:MAG: hypothetical protein L0227_14115 [Chloroflexi bacterium]|nr:hypothetical protein [Chloroflexota bacterium]